MLERSQRLAVYMEGALDGDFGKMGLGILRYSPNEVACVVDSNFAGRDAEEVTGVPRRCPVVASVREARELGADVFVLGIAPSGGLIPEAWFPAIDESVGLGMCVVNGLHDRLSPRYGALKPGQWVWDIRVEPPDIGVATGAAARLSNVRVLMVGTDMAIGKMTAGLELFRAARERGIRAEFVATGQIGITIAGRGVPLDAVRVDFACGAVEREVLRCADAELVIVEGQGALIHPGSTANLPLLRGACPTHLILCHRANQTHLARLPEIQIPALLPYARLYEDLAAACETFPRPETVGVALNTFRLSDSEAAAACQAIESETNLPCLDPVRGGSDRFLERMGL